MAIGKVNQYTAKEPAQTATQAPLSFTWLRPRPWPTKIQQIEHHCSATHTAVQPFNLAALCIRY